MDYRPCPSFPGYSASLCGSIVRDARKSGTPLKSRLDGNGQMVVRVTAFEKPQTVRVARIVNDAWGEVAPYGLARPRHSITYGEAIQPVQPVRDTRAAYAGFTLAEEYRVIPSAPKYEINSGGRVRNCETMKEATVTETGRYRDRIYVGGTYQFVQTLINEAWPEIAETLPARTRTVGDRPLPTYATGKVLTLAEYRATLQSA